MSVLIFVHTCKKYEESRAKLIERTWGKDKENVVFITDNDSSTLKNHFYIGPYPLPTCGHVNVLVMFHLFLQKYSQYDFFMIIDDDSYLYVDKLTTYLSFFDKSEDYWIGDFLNWVALRTTDPAFTCDYQKWPSGGPGLIFTKSCVEKFIRFINSPETNSPSYSNLNYDVWLHCLYMNSDKRIKRVHCPGFHQYNATELLQKKKHANRYQDNHLISIHLEHDLSLLFEFHKEEKEDKSHEQNVLYADANSKKI
jgi:hypothetical protein